MNSALDKNKGIKIEDFCKTKKREDYIKLTQAHVFYIKSRLKGCFKGWRRILFRKWKNERIMRNFYEKSLENYKIKGFCAFVKNLHMNQEKISKKVFATRFYHKKLLKKHFLRWDIRKFLQQEKQKKIVLSIMHWSSFTKWKYFYAFKLQADYEIRLMYLKTKAYLLYKYYLFRNFSARLVIRKFLDNLAVKSCIKKENFKGLKFFIRNSKQKVLIRLKKLVYNRMHWKSIGKKLGSTEQNVKKIIISRVKGIQDKIIELKKQDSFMFWVQYYKDKKKKILSQKDKIFKILEK